MRPRKWWRVGYHLGWLLHTRCDAHMTSQGLDQMCKKRPIVTRRVVAVPPTELPCRSREEGPCESGRRQTLIVER